MSTADDVLRALDEMERRLNERMDRLEKKIDILGTTLLSPHEQAQHKFASLVVKLEPRSK